MSSFNKTRRSVHSNLKPRPASIHPFAEGLIDPQTRTFVRARPYTSADLQWAAQAFGETTTDYDVVIPAPAPMSGGAPTDADFDLMAAESAALDRLEMGLCL